MRPSRNAQLIDIIAIVFNKRQREVPVLAAAIHLAIGGHISREQMKLA